MNATHKIAAILLLSGVCQSAVCAQAPGATDGSRESNKTVAWKPTVSWLAAHPEEPAAGPRLAILVSADETHRAQAIALQGLLEAEAFAGWHGEMLERAQFAIVLREQQLGATLTEANSIKLGQVSHTDFLLMVDLTADRIRCRINQFPATTVVAEFDVVTTTEDRSARQIALRAFRAMAERSRDQNRIAVAIGSFLVDDPFSKYTDLDQTLHAALRLRLSKVARLDLAERFHPTQLLREFELARGGHVPSVMAQLTAPISDALIFGDVRPTTKQNLDRKDIELEFRVRIVSPTGLFDPRDVTFVLSKTDWNHAAEQITQSLQRIVTDLPKTLARQPASDGFATEFKTLKERAIRLLPSPPKEDGNFFSKGSYKGSWQSGKPAEIERAMRAVENAMLFTGDDTQLLVYAVPLLFELAQSESPGRRIEKPTVLQKALLELSCDYIETALALNFNENSRGIAYDTLRRDDYWLAVPDRTRPIIERMAREGVLGGWYPHEARYARQMLIENSPDIRTKIEQFRATIRNAEIKPDERFRLLQILTIHYLKQINAKAGPAELDSSCSQLGQLAGELLNQTTTFSRGMGLYVKIFLSYHAHPRDSAWKSDLLEAVDLIPTMSKELGAEFINCGYSLWVYSFIRWNLESSTDESSLELLRRYIARQIEIQNYQHGQLADAMMRLLPTLKGGDERADALPWLTNLLERYTYVGSADFDRMKLARWRNHLLQAVSDEEPSRRQVMVDVVLNSETAHTQAFRPDTTRVKKIVSAFDRIWALRCDYSLQDRLGEVFVLDPAENAATRLKGLSERITDIVAGEEQLAIASIDKGLVLVDRTGEVVKNFDPATSPLPTPMVRTVASAGTRFLLGLPGRVERTGYSSYFIYDLDPLAGSLKKTDTTLDYHSYYQTRFDNVVKRVVSQTWDNRYFEVNGVRWTLRRMPVRDAIHRITVTDTNNQPVFTAVGFDLNYVYDFVHWKGQLVFATGNGLYVSHTGTDKLTLLLSEVDLEFFSLCPVGETLFVGTNRGFHRLHAKFLPE